jgi:hypothetical protein
MGRTMIADIRDSKFPDLTIAPNTFVVWRNLDPVVHSAETLPKENLPDSSQYFNAGPMQPGGLSSPVLFRNPGTIGYICRFHMGMSGVVNVKEGLDAKMNDAPSSEKSSPHGHEGHDHLKHTHGFVTGGRSGKRLFMTHTPVIADERHHFQVILQGSLTEDAHTKAYDDLRKSGYGDNKVQIFHEHLSLADIGTGVVKRLPAASFEYYPNGVDAKGFAVPGLAENIPVNLDRVLHFHQFDPDSEYPSGLAYLIYGDLDDIFIDHHINRAPSFHSVAKLGSRPEFWNGPQRALSITVPSKRIIDVSPKLIERVAFVDNSFHMFWLPPSGIYLRPPGRPDDPLDPKKEGTLPTYDVLVEGGAKGKIEIAKFLHFDVRLLNYGVLIT